MFQQNLQIFELLGTRSDVHLIFINRQTYWLYIYSVWRITLYIYYIRIGQKFLNSCIFTSVFQKFTLHKLVRSYKYFCSIMKVLFLAFSDPLLPQDACIRKGISKIWISTAFGGRQISSNVQISWFSRHSKLVSDTKQK